MEKIKEFCDKWKIVEFSLFGSVLTDEFRSDSDVDVMVKFAPESHWSLFDMVDLEDELKIIIGRDVDVVTRPSVERSENYIMRKSILGSSRTFYAA
ncbi:nucleotidyltransferase domain-containing protein [bacterium]|nr:nucleotidyltransferase domain-containing protein [bacterium]